MPLRSTVPTVGAMCGNDMLDRADALVRELGIRPGQQQDARQEAVLAELEGRDPVQAVRRYVDNERSLGLTGGGTRPTVLRLTPGEMDWLQERGTIHVSDPVTEREQAEGMETIAGTVLLGLSARDRRIVRLTAQGWTQEEIAQALGLSQRGVGKIVAKIQTKSRALLRSSSSGG
jgi:RNA polymerase sigma factor (sigma-70 family)